MRPISTLDTFKQRTLAQLAHSQEEHNFYPIGPSDLMFVQSCALCGSQNMSLLIEVRLETGLNFFATSVCNDCIYTFRTISPAVGWFKKCWKAIATQELKVFNPQVEEIRRRRYEDYWQLLSNYAPGGRMLDVGAAYGTGSSVFRDRGYRVEALEPEDDKANYIRQFHQIPVHSGTVEEITPTEGSYDLVVFAHCLEHLDHPKVALKKIAALVEPVSGILYVEVPVTRNFVTWSDALYLTHKSNFTEQNLLRLLAEVGLEVLEITWFRHTPEEPWDLGVVARPAVGVGRSEDNHTTGDSFAVEDVEALYRKGLPVSSVPPLDQVLRYRVPYIEQFYCTLRLDTKRVVEPDDWSGFIGFEPAAAPRLAA